MRKSDNFMLRLFDCLTYYNSYIFQAGKS